MHEGDTLPAAVPEDLAVLLEHMVTINASDLYLTAGSPPIFRVDGVGHPARAVFDAGEVDRLAKLAMTPEQQELFARDGESNFAVTLGSDARFRVNVFRQRGHVGMVFRLIRLAIESLDQLGLPLVLKDVSLSRRGLVLVVGATGSGKSTTLAAMLDFRNESETGHIITIEDPIEFVHEHKKAIVSQREVGVDTESFGAALRNALRQAPDVIFVGEIRDVETMEAALTLAETGHLCLSTLHSNNANQAIERILNFFPPSRLEELKLQLSLNLRAIISQRLVPKIGGGRAAALEILLDTPRIRDLIRRGDVEVLKDAMEQGRQEGCATFDSALFGLVAEGRITAEDALKVADSPNNLRIRLERLQPTGEGEPPDSGLSLLPLDEL